jgi:hypothetical protein
MQAAPHVLVRLRNAVVTGALAGWVFRLLGTSFGAAIMDGVAFAGAVYVCTTVLKGSGVLVKVDAAFAAVAALNACWAMA